MNVLVTGAAGFIGRALLKDLTAQGHTSIPVVRRGTGIAHELVVPDIDAQIDWGPALSGCAAVVHLAARVHVMRDMAEDPLSLYCATNTDATLNLASQAALAGVKRFVFVSTIKVNGEGRDVPYREIDVPQPEDAYAISKWKAEQGLMTISRETGMSVVIIRPPLVYGPGVKGNFAKLLHWVGKGIPLPFGALQNRRSLLALDNLVSFIALCVDPAKSPKAANEVFLISDGEDLSTPELLSKVAQSYGTNARLIPVPPAWMQFSARMLGKTAAADRLLGSLVIDSSKARELLGWKPVVTMDEQLRKMVNNAASI